MSDGAVAPPNVVVVGEPSGIDPPAGDVHGETAVSALSALVANTLADLGAGAPGEVSLGFVDRAEMLELNREAMGSDRPTDVLSFPIDPFPEPEDPDRFRLIGDIVLCDAVAADQAAAHAGTLIDELALLCVHSCLHLCGYDHAAEADRAEMWAEERRLLEAWWRPLTRDPWTDR